MVQSRGLKSKRSGLVSSIACSLGSAMPRTAARSAYPCPSSHAPSFSDVLPNHSSPRSSGPVHTPSALAPTIVISTASSAWMIPPVPTMGTPGKRTASSATTACATGRIAAPDIHDRLPSPPMTGPPVSTSIISVGPIESIAVNPFAPASSAPSAAAYSWSPQLNVSLARMGRPGACRRTTRTRSTMVSRV